MMTAMPPVYDEVLAYLGRIRELMDAIEESLRRLPGEEKGERPPAQPG